MAKTLRSIPKRHGIPNLELIRAYVGQLCLGKSDFKAVDNVRGDRFFQEALGIRQLPSATRPRQRFDEDARALIDRRGQRLLVPEIALQGWWTSLAAEAVGAAPVIALYDDRATCEPFHSEYEIDLDLERLPSGKFDTNDLVPSCAALAYNILRWSGLRGLLGPQAPIRHTGKRRRLRAVIQELMVLAARLIDSGRRLRLRFGTHCPGLAAFRGVYHALATG